MRKITASLLLCLWALFSLGSPASAETCPDFYRFVNFGQIGNDGVLYSGGSVFRAESLEGNSVIQFDLTECLSVRDIGKDGHGNPIPVVASIDYKPELISTEFTQLRIRKVGDTATEADRNAERHRERLKESDTAIARGSNFLCADNGFEDSISCQVVSPYLENIALVVYCTAHQCDMPVLAVDNKIMVSAVWRRNPTSIGNDELAGAEISEQVSQIHQFLSPLTSLSPR